MPEMPKNFREIGEAVAKVVGDDLKTISDDGVMSLESKVTANKGTVTIYAPWSLCVSDMVAIYEIDKKIFAAAVVQLRTDARNKHRQGVSQGMPKGKYEVLLALVNAGIIASEDAIEASVKALGYDAETEKTKTQIDALIEASTAGLKTK